MTRRDYLVLEDAFKEAYHACLSEEEKKGVVRAIKYTATKIRLQNPSFSIERFYSGCGVNEVFLDG